MKSSSSTFGASLARRKFSPNLNWASKPLSTVHRGTAFEERSLKLLRDNMSMSLRRVGGKEDGGIDLLGWWWLPDPSGSANSPRRRIRVLGQCKAEKKKASPKYVRELEGVLHRFLPSIQHRWVNPIMAPSTHDPVVALLISESSFTQSTLLRAMSSPIPFFLLHVPPSEESASEIEAERIENIGMAVWNSALGGTHGVLEGRMEVRWERELSNGTGRPGLWWERERLSSWTPDATSSAMTDLDEELELKATV